MRRLLTICLLFSVLSLRTLAATGDIIGALVETNGWVLELTFESKGVPANGAYTNGTGGFALGFATNNSGNGNINLSLVSTGWTAAGATTFGNRALKGTKQLRMPFPNHTNNDVTASGGNAIARIALSHQVYLSDSNLTVTVAANVWSNNNAATAFTVVNGSTIAWPKPAANWTCVPKQQVGSSFRLSVVSAHSSAEFQNAGKPVQAVRFRSVSATAGVTNFATLTKTRSDLVSNNLGGTNELWVSEWVYDVSTSPFAQGELITNNFDVYPYLGDSILSSDDGVYYGPPGYCPITMFCDKSGNFSTNIALVAPWGSDTAGRVTNVSVLNANPALALLTLDGASKQLAATNLLKGHGDTDGGIIYLMSTNPLTSYAWVGASGSYGTNGRKTFLVVTNYPTNNLGDIVIGTQSGNQRLTAAGGAVKICGVLFTNAGAGGVIYDQGDLWVDQCAMNSTASALFYRATNAYFTRCWVTNLTQGLFPAGETLQVSLVRDCIFTGFVRKLMAHTVVGNYKAGKTVPVSGLFNFSGAAAGNINATNPIIAYNYIGGFGGGADFLQYPLTVQANSITIINNVFETTGGSANPALVSIANDGSIIDQHNVISWNNTEMGERSSVSYNDTGTTPFYRFSWNFLNNLVANYNTKHDTFGTRSGARVGGWPILYGVGWTGNASVQLTNVGGADSFANEFMGLNSYQPLPTTSPNGLPTGTPNPSNYVAFVFDGSRSGAQTGNGDYRVLASSPIRSNLRTSWVLPCDLAGNPRRESDPPGAYAFGIRTYPTSGGSVRLEAGGATIISP